MNAMRGGAHAASASLPAIGGVVPPVAGFSF
jgi:hypothetical protein